MSKEDEASFAPESSAACYTIERHQHLFAAWAACRAASVKGCRFSVEQGRAILEACGFNTELPRPDQLPPPEGTDDQHRRWRTDVIEDAKSLGLTFTHGGAAKLINIYLKSRFVCGGYYAHQRVRALHPPIDDVLLAALGDHDVGGYAKQWPQARRTRWSKLNSEQYEQLIGLVRQGLKGEPLWKIEEYWKGNQ